jgi:integrase/recombinase XerD
MQKRDSRGRHSRGGKDWGPPPGSPDNPWAHPLLGEWEAWLRAARRSPQTIRNRPNVINRFARDLQIDAVSASPNDVVDWFDANPQWETGTVVNYHAAFRAWFSWLQLMDHRIDNPMSKLEAPRRPTAVPRPIADQQLARLLPQQRLKTRAYIVLAAFAGLRVHEIAQVRGEHLDLEMRTLWVRGKGGSLKTIPLHQKIIDVAEEMPERGLWFPGRAKAGKPVTPGAVGQTIRQAMRRAGITATAHQLRHWFGTACLNECGDIRLVQTLMRHASITSTQIYAEVSGDRRAEVIDGLRGVSKSPDLRLVRSAEEEREALIRLLS